MRQRCPDDPSSASALTRRRFLQRTTLASIATGLAGCSALDDDSPGRSPGDVTEWPPAVNGDELVVRSRYETLTSGDSGFSDEYGVEILDHGAPHAWDYSVEKGGRSEPPGLVDGTVQAVERFVTNTDEGPTSVLDAVTPTAENLVPIATADGLLHELPTDVMPNWENVPDDVRDLSYYQRDGEVYAVPVERQLAPLVYDPEYFDEPPTSWDVLWDEAFAGRIATAAPLNEFRYNGFQIAALRSGQDLASPDDEAALIDARVELERNEVRYSSVWEAVDRFVEGDAVVGQLTLPMIYAARFERGASIEYTVPDEGAVATVGYTVVPRAARNPVTGLLYADWCLRPDVAVRLCDAGRKPAVDVGDYLAGERGEFFEWSDDWDLVWQTPDHYDAYRDLYDRIDWGGIERVGEE